MTTRAENPTHPLHRWVQAQKNFILREEAGRTPRDPLKSEVDKLVSLCTQHRIQVPHLPEKLLPERVQVQNARPIQELEEAERTAISDQVRKVEESIHLLGIIQVCVHLPLDLLGMVCRQLEITNNQKRLPIQSDNASALLLGKIDQLERTSKTLPPDALTIPFLPFTQTHPMNSRVGSLTDLEKVTERLESLSAILDLQDQPMVPPLTLNINLQGITNPCQEGLIRLIQAYPRITELHLISVQNAVIPDFTAFFKRLELGSLETLSLGFSSVTSFEGIERFSRIKTLSLLGVSPVDLTPLESLTHLKELKILHRRGWTIPESLESRLMLQQERRGRNQNRAAHGDLTRFISRRDQTQTLP